MHYDIFVSNRFSLDGTVTTLPPRHVPGRPTPPPVFTKGGNAMCDWFIWI